MDSGLIEACNGRRHAECRDDHGFVAFDDARQRVEGESIRREILESALAQAPQN